MLARQSFGQTDGESEVPRPLLESSVNGYLDSRTSVAKVRTDGLLPADDVPAAINLTEVNIQLKLRWGDRAFALVDASFFYQKAWAYPGGPHDVPAYRPLSVISEAYASYNFSDHLNLTLGKKRIVWGPGQAFNPTDLLNPPKDPTDPTLQRAGAWLARVEAPFERFTASFVAAAAALRTYGGVPTSLAYCPGYPTAEGGRAGINDFDDQPHYALASRLYALVADSDVGLYYVFTNRYNDAFENKSRLGASVSRLVGKALEVHAEALVQRGTLRPFKTLGDDLVGKTLVGGRYTFGDDSLLGLEYHFNGDGYTPAEFDSALKMVAAVAGAGLRPSLPAASSDAGSPQKFVFDPFRRHYLFLTYLKPHIRDDFTVQATVIMNLQDFTGQLAPLIAWSVREWASLTVAAFVPVPGLASREVEVGDRHYGEFSLSPIGWRILASVRLFY